MKIDCLQNVNTLFTERILTVCAFFYTEKILFVIKENHLVAKKFFFAVTTLFTNFSVHHHMSQPPCLPRLSCYNTFMSELRQIPNVGQQTEKELIAMGYTTLESLKGKKAEDLYREECALRGVEIDRCQLYLYRAVQYFVNTENPDPEKSKWWFWKDDFAEPSPCGAVCTECDRFPKECGGCRKIKGKVFWVPFTGTGETVCPIYSCCVTGKKQKTCGGCPQLPCSRFVNDPTVSEEENAAHLKKMLERLAQ